MPDYSRPHFADPFLGTFGEERTGQLASDLPPAGENGAALAVAPPQNQLMRVIAILLIAAVVYFILKKLTAAKETKETPAIEA